MFFERSDKKILGYIFLDSVFGKGAKKLYTEFLTNRVCSVLLTINRMVKKINCKHIS